MMINVILTLLFWLTEIFHPYYVSVTEMKHDSKRKEIDISCRIFANDLEAAIEKNYKVQIDILKPIDKKKVDLLIADYIKKHLILNVDGKNFSLNYLGYEIEEEAAWCYFTADKVNRIKSIRIKNDILFKEHEEQVNMLHVIYKGSRKSTKLDNPESLAAFAF